ncbi:tRNA (5-methylaminomethyl-2-thiouridine)(34)-methyltransferase MnmD [Flavobacterium filum]|uniref:tRNA (5-methylaminomethyl-2-thiouridine)(34)-methyltransferase MnmD n=1 Tax=Flavobacterium TaxID=237 RepID=UPI0003F5FDA5|nr:tRNA (5-methylaminomethyl-2-thiouridine)(34)-methyltransferase MnmD [Flavobacterium filum]
MKREIIITSDGSTSIHLPEWEESYHSKHGAIQEAQHVFIKNGLSLCKGQSVSVLEIGFGTGLNAFITLLESHKNMVIINYVGVEAYPISSEEVIQMNYPNQLNANEYYDFFSKMHQCSWEKCVTISEHFRLIKRKQKFQEIKDVNQFDIIYFDAFGYRVQPELWSVEIFTKMFEALKEGGILVTYACRGPIKNAMKEAGFRIEKLAGPPGKREMLRGWK